MIGLLALAGVVLGFSLGRLHENRKDAALFRAVAPSGIYNAAPPTFNELDAEG